MNSPTLTASPNVAKAAAKGPSARIAQLRTWALPASLFAASLFWLAGMSNLSLRLDEAQSIWQISRSPQAVLTELAKDVHLPLYALLLHFWKNALSGSVLSLRLLSLLFLLGSIVAIYALGKLAFGSRAGRLAAALASVSPFLIWYGGETRMYSLLLFLATLNHYFFLKLLLGNKVQGKADWAGYFVTGLLGVYTHYFFWLIFASQAFFSVLNTARLPARMMPKLAVSWAIMLAALAPWIYFVITSAGGSANTQPLLYAPKTIDLFNSLTQFLLGFHADRLNSLLVSLWPLAVMLLFFSLGKRAKLTETASYLLTAALLPIIGTFLFSLWVRPIYLSRYLIFVVPCILLLLAWLITSFPSKIRGWAAGAAIAVLAFAGIAQALLPNTPIKEDYRQAAAHLSLHATAKDVVLVSAPFTVYPVDFYYRGQASLQTVPLWNRFQAGPIPEFSATELRSQVEGLRRTHKNAFLLQSYDQGYQEEIKKYFDENFPLQEQVSFSPGLRLLVYDMAGFPPFEEKINN